MPGSAYPNPLGPGQLRAARGALEHLHTEVVFQLLDRTRQRRLFDMQALGCAREMQLFGDSDKTAKVAQFQVGCLLLLYVHKIAPHACIVVGVRLLTVRRPAPGIEVQSSWRFSRST